MQEVMALKCIWHEYKLCDLTCVCMTYKALGYTVLNSKFGKEIYILQNIHPRTTKYGYKSYRLRNGGTGAVDSK